MADKVTESVSTNPYQTQIYSAGQNDKNTLTITDFFKLMAAQLSNQDVSDPMSNSELMAQMTQMAMVQSMTTMTETMETMTKAMENSQAVTTQTYAAGLVGQEVTVAVMGEDEEGNQIPVGVKTGKVVSVDFTTATPSIRLEGDKTDYSLTQVLGMGAIQNPYQNVNPGGDGDTSGTEGDTGTSGTEGGAGGTENTGGTAGTESAGNGGNAGAAAGTEGAGNGENAGTAAGAEGTGNGENTGAAAAGNIADQAGTGVENAGTGQTDTAKENAAADQTQSTGSQTVGLPEEDSKTGAAQGTAGAGQNEATESAGTQIPTETENEVGSAAAGAADAEHMVNTDDTAADRTEITDNTEKTEPAETAERME